MSLEIGLCKRCGGVYDKDEIDDGYCLKCPTPEIDQFVADTSDSVEWIGDCYEPPKVDWNALGDCE